MIEYIDKRDINAELLLEFWKGLSYKFNYLSDFVELRKHDNTPFKINYSEQKLLEANVVDYNATPVLKSGASYETMMVDPFHIKNAQAFSVTDDGNKLIKTSDGFKIDPTALSEGMQALENYRRNLMWRAVASMVSTKKFTYKNGSDLEFSIPYDAMIGDLKPFTSGDFRMALDEAAIEFEARSGAPVRAVVVSPATALKIKQKPEIIKYFEVIQRDHDAKQPRFMISSVEFIVEINKYYQDNSVFAIPDDVCVFISEQDNTGHQPILINRGKNALNKYNADSPAFDSYEVAPSPFTVHLELYDNLIPTLSRKNSVMHWKIQ